jgi:hypothetical protein
MTETTTARPENPAYVASVLAMEQTQGFHAVNAETGTPERDATEQEIAAYLAANDDKRTWCRRGVLVGGLLIEPNYRNHPNRNLPDNQGNWAWL